MDPFGRIALEELGNLKDGNGGTGHDKRMNMILNAANLKRSYLVGPGHTGEIAPNALLEVW
jgi:hypothetical protein